MTDRAFVEAYIDKNKDLIIQTSQRIWEFAELPYAEHQSARLLCDILKAQGFAVTQGVADIPTSFTATFGSGRPVMGFLGEYDALDILSQEAGNPQKQPVKEGAPGHGCGHNLLGAGGVGRGPGAQGIPDSQRFARHRGVLRLRRGGRGGRQAVYGARGIV